MSFIPQHKLLPQDKVDVLDLGPAEGRFEKPQTIRMHASDARHAMDVDPERYVLPPDPEAEAAPGQPAADDILTTDEDFEELNGD